MKVDRRLSRLFYTQTFQAKLSARRGTTIEFVERIPSTARPRAPQLPVRRL